MKHEKNNQTTQIETILIENLIVNSIDEINLELNENLSTALTTTTASSTTSILKFARTTNDFPSNTTMALILPQ